MMKDTELLAKAIAFAADKHKEQLRKDGTPYIYHPLKVAELVKNEGHSIKCQIVAILHDVLEDTDASEEDIRSFGEDVLVAVKLLTRLPGTPENVYVEGILENPMATIVKNADKLHNIKDAGTISDIKWSKKYIQKSKLYYEGKFSKELDATIEEALKSLNASSC